MSKKIFFVSLFILIQCQSFAQSPFQSVSRRANEVSLLYFQEETAGMVKIQPIYSKARGVTTLSAINNINNRALRKLKTEAAMLGADAVYITNNYQKGVQFFAPVQVAYSAVAYSAKSITVEQVKALSASKKYIARTRVAYNRNSFSEKMKFYYDPKQELTITNLSEEQGQIWAEITRNNSKQRFRVVIANDNHITLSRYLKDGKVLESIEFVDSALFRNL